MTGPQALLNLEVEGIVCSGCATDMETVLLDTDGVIDVKASYAEGTVAITYDPEEIDQETLISQVNGFGMKAKVAEHS